MVVLLLRRSLQSQQQILLLKSQLMGMSSLYLRCKITSKYIWNTQVGTPLTCRDLSRTLTISWRISSSGPKPRNWSCITSISYGFWWLVLNSSIHEGSQNTSKLDRSFTTQFTKWCTREYQPQGYLVHYRYWEIPQRNSNSHAESLTKK